MPLDFIESERIAGNRDRRQVSECFIGRFSLLALTPEALQEFWKPELPNWIGKALGPHWSSRKEP